MGARTLALLTTILAFSQAAVNQFPEGFQFGCATASYQVEGGWDADGKGENIWDRLTHTNPNWTRDGQNGDVACDSYHNFRRDVEMLKEMGVNFYRFSISWSRILPTGHINSLNQAGVDYYNNLIDELLANGIYPFVTMYHWDLPQPMQELGGWPNPLLADYFADYARVLYENFGDRVKWWLTFNEPVQTCSGYISQYGFAPAIDQHGYADYLSAHTIIRAHAKAYRLYEAEFAGPQGGKVGITLDSGWNEPVNTDPANVEAAETSLQFQMGWFAHAIFHPDGDYPPVMRQRVDSNSISEGLLRSRLPYFTSEEVASIRGSSDFLGFNHYSTNLVAAGEVGDVPSRYRDTGAITWQDPSWNSSASDWLKVVPWGFRKALNWLKNEYNNPTIIVTENGFSDLGELEDYGRVEYYKTYLAELLKAVNIDGVNVTGYTAWSLMDNFEWSRGYTEKFGLYHVDFNDPSRPRTPKESSRVYTNIIATREIPIEYFPEGNKI